jgi:hypothetical protein
MADLVSGIPSRSRKRRGSVPPQKSVSCMSPFSQRRAPPDRAGMRSSDSHTLPVSGNARYGTGRPAAAEAHPPRCVVVDHVSRPRPSPRWECSDGARRPAAGAVSDSWGARLPRIGNVNEGSSPVTGPAVRPSHGDHGGPGSARDHAWGGCDDTADVAGPASMARHRRCSSARCTDGGTRHGRPSAFVALRCRREPIAAATSDSIGIVVTPTTERTRCNRARTTRYRFPARQRTGILRHPAGDFADGSRSGPGQLCRRRVGGAPRHREWTLW